MEEENESQARKTPYGERLRRALAGQIFSSSLPLAWLRLAAGRRRLGQARPWGARLGLNLLTLASMAKVVYRFPWCIPLCTSCRSAWAQKGDFAPFWGQPGPANRQDVQKGIHHGRHIHHQAIDASVSEQAHSTWPPAPAGEAGRRPAGRPPGHGRPPSGHLRPSLST